MYSRYSKITLPKQTICQKKISRLFSSYIFSFSHVLLNLFSTEKNAATVVVVVFIAIFLTCPGPTVSKVMSFQTEVDKAW